ncbi:MAG: hypothetical protein V1793_13590 [Pseudomonadota bacterium]
MKIVESTVAMESSRDFKETEVFKLDREISWKGILGEKLDAALSARAEFKARLVQIRAETRMLYQDKSQIQDLPGVQGPDLPEGQDSLTLVTAILQELFSRLATDITYSLTGVRLEGPGRLMPIALAPRDPGIALSMRQTLTSSHYESEKTAFQTDGEVRTQDGRTIDFSVGLKMEREFMSETTATWEEDGKIHLLDPLVVNFGKEAPQLSDTVFSFDLNMDGSNETIPRLVRGTGFLALDLNNDGTISDGSELFGAVTDNGFAELAQYDLDHNSWIDENDPVFGRLSVWSTDPETGGSLASLKDTGVGAIFLGNQETRFDLTDDSGSLRGRVERTGVFLNEDGGAGTVQELKFVV